MTGLQHDVRYDFRIRATDHVGNNDPWPNEPQVTTLVRSAHATAQMHHFHTAVLKPNAPNTTTFTISWSHFSVPEAPIATYEIYYRYNNAAWKLWQTFPASASSGVFPFASLGHTDGVYSFEAIAITTAGDREPRTGVSEAAMLVDLADKVHPKGYLPFIHRQVSVAAAGEQ